MVAFFCKSSHCEDDKAWESRERCACNIKPSCSELMVGWMFLGLTALWDSISVYIGLSPKEREKKERKDKREKNVQTIAIRTHCKRSRPLSYCYP